MNIEAEISEILRIYLECTWGWDNVMLKICKAH